MHNANLNTAYYTYDTSHSILHTVQWKLHPSLHITNHLTLHTDHYILHTTQYSLHILDRDPLSNKILLGPLVPSVTPLFVFRSRIRRHVCNLDTNTRPGPRLYFTLFDGIVVYYSVLSFIVFFTVLYCAILWCTLL